MHIAELKYHEKASPVKDLIMISLAGKSALPGPRNQKLLLKVLIKFLKKDLFRLDIPRAILYMFTGFRVA